MSFLRIHFCVNEHSSDEGFLEYLDQHTNVSFLAQLVERITSNCLRNDYVIYDEVSRSIRLGGIFFFSFRPTVFRRVETFWNVRKVSK